ncbi:hypothetical protein AB833_09460 [Chromatiales bacterium (ex Bugula neritina AB1)]|nr:hypothetical protein AB833_09460 [Chromatiales bacterium (ex Bugula neritina AB1)]
MSDDSAGKYVCTGGFIISGMIVGSAWGGTGGAAVGGVGAVPGVAIGALGGALWAAAICTRPAVKRIFQKPVDKLENNINKLIETSSLKSELQSFVKESAPDMASKPDAAIAFMLEHLGEKQKEIVSLASNDKASIMPLMSAEAKHGMEILKTAKPLT